jgi:hypothetical protein
MNTEVRTSNGEFACEKCSFYCIKRSNYNAHLLTKKHKQQQQQHQQPHRQLSYGCVEVAEKRERGQMSSRSVARKEPYVCENCEHTYKDRSGLWRHRKKCVKEVGDTDDKANSVKTMVVQQGRGEVVSHCGENTTAVMLNMIYDLVKQNQEIKELLLKQNEQLMENAARPVVIQHQIINNHTTNNHIGVNLFLQEKCNSALNLTEFVDNLTVQMGDLEMVGRLGFVEGISRIILNELNRLDIYTRPIHCTDTKREVIYIRESNEWTRDTDANERTKHAIARVANKNLNKIPEWRRMHPETEIFESPAYEMNMQIMVQSLGGLGGTTHEKSARNQEKILKRILPSVVMDKKTVGLLTSE